MLGDETTFTIVSERARHQPWGLMGGLGGSKIVIILRKNRRGKGTKLQAKKTVILNPHDVVEIDTACGGGYESPIKREQAKIASDLKDESHHKKYARKYYRQVDAIR